MRKLRRVVSKKTGLIGYRGRFSIGGQRFQHTVWDADRDRAAAEFIKYVRDRKQGLPTDNWTIPYTDLVSRFIVEAPLSSETRRKELKRVLTLNPLGVCLGSDLARPGALSAMCRELIEKKKCSDEYVRKSIQQPLKQVASWAAGDGRVFPYDPLASWKLMVRTSNVKKKGVFTPVEMRAILKAAQDLDGKFIRSNSTAIIFATLLTTGNRPTAVCGVAVGNFDGKRIGLPPGVGNKLNGIAAVPDGLAADIYRSLAMRGRPAKAERLFMASRGGAIDRRNIQNDFKLSAALAFVRQLWPNNEPTADQFDVALGVQRGTLPKIDGKPPTTVETKARRADHIAANERVFRKLREPVEALLKGRPLYSLRKTHITWAKLCGVPKECRDLQVGHVNGGIEEKHYIDREAMEPKELAQARESAQAVWDVLTGARRIEEIEERQSLALAAGAEESAQMVTNVVTLPEKPRKTAAQGTSKSLVIQEYARRESNPQPQASEACTLSS